LNVFEYEYNLIILVICATIKLPQEAKKMSFNYTDYQKAYSIAKRAHGDTLNSKCGEVYFEHCIRVARRFVARGQFLEAATAILHDTIEDTSIDENLIAGISEELFLAVYAMTKSNGLTYMAYKLQVAGNATATAVKLEDILDNFNLNRINGDVTVKDAKRSLRYAQFACQLLGIENYNQAFNTYIERGSNVQDLIQLTSVRNAAELQELTVIEALNMVMVAEALVYYLS
jgi:hypothetical protein